MNAGTDAAPVWVGYYASVQNGSRRGLLLGPFATHAEAESHVPAAQAAAEQIDSFAGFYAYGTARVQTTRQLPQGKLNRRAGITPTVDQKGQ